MQCIYSQRLFEILSARVYALLDQTKKISIRVILNVQMLALKWNKNEQIWVVAIQS